MQVKETVNKENQLKAQHDAVVQAFSQKQKYLEGENEKQFAHIGRLELTIQEYKDNHTQQQALLANKNTKIQSLENDLKNTQEKLSNETFNFQNKSRL